MAEKSVIKLGFWSALVASLFIAAPFMLALLEFLGLPWMVTAPGSMLLLALFFRGDRP